MRHFKPFLRMILVSVCLLGLVMPVRGDEARLLFQTDLQPFYNPGDLIDWEVYITIEDVEGNGRDSQGLISFVFDVASNTGIMQDPTYFSPTSVNVPEVNITHPVWRLEGGQAVFVGGFGFFGINDLGNRTSQPGSVLGIGASIPLNWRRDVDNDPSNGLQPEVLHNIGYGTPPGTDLGGHPVPSPEMGPRDQWYLVGGTVVAPATAGTYQVDLLNPAGNFFPRDVDLNTGQGPWIPPEIPVFGDTFTFLVIPEPGSLAIAILTLAAVTVRRRK